MTPLALEPLRTDADVRVRGVLEQAASLSVACAVCQRTVSAYLTARMKLPRLLVETGRPLVSRADYCRWCARPLSERAQRVAPLDGFIALARAMMGREWVAPLDQGEQT